MNTALHVTTPSGINIPNRKSICHVQVVTAVTSIALLVTLALYPVAANAIDDGDFLEATSLLLKAQSSRDDSSVQAAVERWKALAAAEPGNPLVRTYTGSAVSMQATTTVLPWKKMGYTEDGLAMIDKALASLTSEHDAQKVAGSPVSLLTRFSTASTFLALPAMFNRGPRGEDQLNIVLKHPGFDGSALAFKSNVWLTAGAHAAKTGQKEVARKYFEQVIQAKAPLADTARKQLELL